MDNWLGLDTRPRMSADEAATYERGRSRGRSRELTQSLIKLCFFYSAYVLADMVLLGDVTALSMALRLGLILPLSVALFVFLQGPRSVAIKEYALLALAVLGNLVWCLILVSSENPLAIQYYYAAVIFQMVVTISVRGPFHASLAGTFACFVINYGFMGFVTGSSQTHVLYSLFFYLPAVLQTLIASYQLEAERQINFLQTHENERLKQELSRHNDVLERLALTDALTQLPNRRGTDAALAELRREPGATLADAAVLLIDIDHFKAYNDGYGHQAGDDCLKHVARAMRHDLPLAVHLARHGGEEFLAILPGCDAAQATRHAESLRRIVRAQAIPHEHASERTGFVTVSIGVACGSILTDKATDALIEAADEALYAVKADGRNGWCVAGSLVVERELAGAA